MKQKTVKSAAKRIKITKNGKIIQRRRTTQHLALKKSKRARRLSGKFVTMDKTNVRKIRRMVPYR